MALSPCDKLGQYEIVAPVGAGRRGKVYRTRHAKLNRDFAINVLPAALSLLFLFAIPVFSQNQAAAPAFEVAAVKANKSGELRMSVDLQPGGKLVMHNVPMKVLIMFAYHLRPEALAGGPAWIESDRYDVVAKAAETGPPDDVRRMMQTLLAERFKLAVHREQKVMEAYGLVLAKSGTKLKPAEAALLSGQGCRPGQGQPGQRHVDCRHVSMAGTGRHIAGIGSAGDHCAGG